MIHEFHNPIPVITIDGKEGYVWYVQTGGQWENDIYTVVLCEGGIIRHFLSNQIFIYYNSTFEIKPKLNNNEVKKRSTNRSARTTNAAKTNSRKRRNRT